MAAESTVPQLVDKKRGSYAAIAPKLEPKKFNKWKKRMLCYLAGMEPYYIKCIKDGPFQPKTAEGAIKPESQWTQDERRVVVQDQHLKSIIMSCLPDDIMESVISYETAKATWTDLVHSFEGQPNPKKDFQDNSDDDVDERSSEEYLKDLDIEFHERAILANSKRFIKRKIISQVKRQMKTLNVLNVSSSSPADLKVQKYYKAEYKKMKAKLALLEASPSTSQTPKAFQPKNKGLIAETFDWDDEEVSNDEKVTQVKVLVALADDELFVGKNHACNSEWIDITTRKVNILLSMDEDADWKNYLKYIYIDNKYVEVGHQQDSEAESLTPISLLKILQGASPSSEVMSLTFQPHSPKERSGLGIMKNTKPETQDSLNKSVSGTVTVSEIEPTTPLVHIEVKNTEQESKINELTKLVQMLIDENVNSTQKTQESNSKIQQTASSKSVDSSKVSQDSKPKVQNSGSSKSLRPKLIQKPQLKCELYHYTNYSTNDSYRILYRMICKREDRRTSDHEMYTASLKRSKNYKAQPYQYTSPSKQVLKAKAKPFSPCTHCGFNDHIPDDCRNYPECEICGSYDHFTSGHNRVILIRGGVLAESSQSSESSISVKCNTCGSIVHSTTDHNEFDHFKRETHQGAHLVPGQWMLKEYDRCQELSAQICRATSHPVSYLQDAQPESIRKTLAFSEAGTQ
ncbi:hypothetical protein Tco_0351106 [Tanacetum coccineum]